MIITNARGGNSQVRKSLTAQTSTSFFSPSERKHRKEMSDYRPAIVNMAFARGRALEHVLSTVNSPGKV